MSTWTGVWAGGRTREKNGETVWVIDTMRRGVRYSIPLKVQAEPLGTDPEGTLIAPQAVMAELALFERDPAAYKEAHKRDVTPDVTGALKLDAALITEYEQDVLHNEDPKLRVQLKTCKDNVRYLRNWLRVLAGQDLRAITLPQYKAHLKKLKPKRQHISALRALTHWLRREGRLSSAQDASRDLEVPQAGARREELGTAAVAMDYFEKLYAGIRSREIQKRRWGDRTDAQSVRDVLVLRALCGMHHTEVDRLARGVREIHQVTGQGEIAGVAVFLHKKKLPHPQALNAQALAAAERLRKRGRAPTDGQVRRVLNETADALGLPRMLPTQLRHCFITWSLQHGREVQPQSAGVPLGLVRRVVGHTSEDTTIIYDGSVPPMIALPLKLVNVEDPVLPGAAPALVVVG